jgi:hypothetical protein
MPGLVPGIHAFLVAKTWMAGTSPAMTKEKRGAHDLHSPLTAAKLRAMLGVRRFRRRPPGGYRS